MSFYKNVKLIALHSVLHPDHDARLRSIFRWYSKEFHVPLPEVEELPLIDVLQHYFESIYESLEEEDLQQELQDILATDEETRAKDMAEEEEKVLAAQFEKDSAEAARAAELSKMPKTGSIMPESTPRVNTPRLGRGRDAKITDGANQAKTDNLPEIQFVSEEELLNELEAPSIGSKSDKDW